MQALPLHTSCKNRINACWNFALTGAVLQCMQFICVSILYGAQAHTVPAGNGCWRPGALMACQAEQLAMTSTMLLPCNVWTGVRMGLRRGT